MGRSLPSVSARVQDGAPHLSSCAGQIYAWKRAHVPWLRRFLNFWTLIDVTIAVLFGTAEVINFVAVLGDPLRAEYDVSKTKDFFNLYGIAYWTQQRNVIDGCSASGSRGPQNATPYPAASPFWPRPCRYPSVLHPHDALCGVGLQLPCHLPRH